MNGRKKVAAILALCVSVSLLWGCSKSQDTALPTENSTTTQPVTEAPETEPSVTQPPKPAETEYHHRGLHFTLMSDYSAMEEDSNLFSFDNGSVYGSVECYPLDYFYSLSAAYNSQTYAEFLMDRLQGFYGSAELCWDGELCYVIFQDEDRAIVRGLHVSQDVGWSVTLRGPKDEKTLQEMTKIITGCWIEDEQLPSWSVGNRTKLEYMGLQIALPGRLVEEHFTDEKYRFSTTNGQGFIFADSIDNLPENVTTPEEILLWYCERNGQAHSEVYASPGGGFAVTDLSAVSVHCRVAAWRGEYSYWLVQLSSPDGDALDEAIKNVTTDNLPYNRTLEYDLRDYGSFTGLLEELQGQATWGSYTLKLTGLQTEVILDMNGTRVEQIHVFGHNIYLLPRAGVHAYYDGPNGNLGVNLYDYNENVIFSVDDCGYCFTWVFSQENVTSLSPEDGFSTMLIPMQDGSFVYRKTALRYCSSDLDQIPLLPLYMATHKDEVCFIDGTATVSNGEVSFGKGKSYTVDDVYDLDALLAEGKEYVSGDATLEELMEENRVHYPLRGKY